MAGTTHRPNILIFMTDHQRADTVLPEHPALTPNIERFAREGVTFTDAFCPTPHCCPARATFFTGLYPSRHGVWNNVCNDQALSRGLRPGVRLWSEDLADAGYALHFVGKWHVSVEESPADRGWTEHFVSADKRAHHGWHWQQYRELAETCRKAGRATARAPGEIVRPGYGTYRLYGVGEVDAVGALQHDETVVARALDVLPGLAAADQPWCLFVGLIGPHDPYIVPQRYLDRYDPAAVPLPVSYNDALADKPGLYRRLRETRFGQLSAQEVREAIRHFWAYCTYLDDLFGRLLAGLDATGQQEDTVVLYLSDHGDYCGEHGLFAKGIPCFQGAYRVPTLIRWPAGVVRPGRRCAAFVSLADFGPTLLEVAGLPAETADGPRRFTGRSLLPFLRDTSPAAWRDEMHTQCNGVELYYTQRSVMTREYKYVFNGFDRDELYDLQADPHEMRNLADDRAYEEVKRALCRRLWRFAEREGDTAINPYITVGLAPYGPAEAFCE